jgi:hypothetical protein
MKPSRRPGEYRILTVTMREPDSPAQSIMWVQILDGQVYLGAPGSPEADPRKHPGSWDCLGPLDGLGISREGKAAHGPLRAAIWAALGHPDKAREGEAD